MKPSDLLAWHNLLFLLPVGVSVFLLGLSALSVVDNTNADSGDGGAEGDGTDARDAGVPDLGGDEADGDAENNSDDSDTETVTTNGVAGLLGIGKASASIVWNVFALVFGVAGFLANRILRIEGNPTLIQVLPSLGIGLIAGFAAARGVAEIAGRLMPKEATKAISRKALFGLTGRILFPVTETRGRIRVYDEHGGMHDEPCRVAPGKPDIPKGKTARIVDRNAAGRLIVEEV